MSKSLLAGQRLHDLIDQGIITGQHSAVNAASIDVHLGHTFLSEVTGFQTYPKRNLAKKESIALWETKIKDGEAYELYPGKFVLAHTLEFFNLPSNISAEFSLRSSMARNGLEHLHAGWADAGWSGAQLTLELVNVLGYHILAIEPGMAIGQMKFFEHEDAGQNSYEIKGNYNNSVAVVAGFKGEGHG